MYASPRARASPMRKVIPEGPIHDFATVIENTQPEDWQRRTQAFETLVKTIPSGSGYSSREAWFNAPPTLRHLAIPLSELLKDARSTVVKRTCVATSELFSKCQSDARFLLKDIMPTVLAVHAQTVQVIRNYVETMIIDSMNVVPCKMAMPIWLDRLKSDKSRTVREACSLYLGVALFVWGGEAGYLTLEIWTQVGTALIKALRDQTPTVRKNAKKGLETLYQFQTDLFDGLVRDSDLVRDIRVKKLLGRIQAGETVGDDVSVASRSSRAGSVYSRQSYRASVRSPSYSGPATSSSRVSSGNVGIPKTIGVSTPSAPRVTATRSKGGGLGPPIRMVVPFKSTIDSPPPLHRKVGSSPAAATTTSYPTTIPGGERGLGDESFDTVDSHTDLPVIANANELREVAKARSSSRRSSLLQERFKSSWNSSDIDLRDKNDSLLKDAFDDDEMKGLVDKEKIKASNNNLPSEHLRIAHELLEAHKRHVDQIMEILKVEMDALKDFELVLLEHEPRRPTEDEVLEYFESVGLCMEQRTKVGSILQKRMDKISKGGE